jgi:hypothetical protein
MTILAQLGNINRNIELNEKVRQFACLAKAVMLSRGSHGAVQSIVHDHRIVCGPTVKSVVEASQAVYAFPPDTVHRQKAAVAAGTTADTGWALPLADFQRLTNAFLESLRQYGFFDSMLPFTKRVPFRVRVGASTSSITGSVPGQQEVKPISKLNLTTTQISEVKCAAILVMTDELARFGDTVAGDLFTRELSAAIAVATDQQVASILVAGAASFGSSGPTAEHVRVDLRALLNSVDVSNTSNLFLLMGAPIAKALSVLHTSTGAQAFPGVSFRGGEISGIPIAVSSGVPAQSIILADAQQLVCASESVQLASTGEATVQLDSAPDSPPLGNTPLVSLCALNMVGLRAERYVGCVKLTPNGVAICTGINYSGDSPGP